MTIIMLNLKFPTIWYGDCEPYDQIPGITAR